MSEALRLAAVLEDEKMHSMAIDTEAAAELRRLHAENEALKAELIEQARVNGMGGEREARLVAVNSELVAALIEIEWSNDTTWQRDRARAALAKVGESK